MADNRSAETKYAEGIQISRKDVTKILFPSPGGVLVKRVMEQMATVPQFRQFFGAMRAFDSPDQRWACYQRYDWSLRQLPAINIYEGEPEAKSSDNAWLDGSLRVMVFWPAGQRRADWQQIGRYFAGSMENFFASKYCEALLDPLGGLNMDIKVPGLNRLGKELTWTPNVEGIIEAEAVPVTLIDVKYRFDLRKWYSYLEDQGYSRDQPFEKTVFPWTHVGGKIEGDHQGSTQAVVGWPILERIKRGFKKWA